MVSHFTFLPWSIPSSFLCNFYIRRETSRLDHFFAYGCPGVPAPFVGMAFIELLLYFCQKSVGPICGFAPGLSASIH